MMRKLLRRVFYRIPPRYRFLARRLVYLFQDLFGEKDDLSPPKGLIYTGGGDFKKVGRAWKAYFIHHAGLQPGSNFLDVGSGIGRIAIPLAGYLTGQYEGFEPIKVGVDWCRENISSKYPNFNFKHVPLFNDLYNSGGMSAETYQFTYPADHFDVACAISVFTHMLPPEVENYLRQIRRVLRRDGYLVATFFLLDRESEAFMENNSGGLDFKHRFDNHALIDLQTRSANVAYTRDYLETLFRDNGFSIAHFERGFWSGAGKRDILAFQDIYTLRKGS